MKNKYVKILSVVVLLLSAAFDIHAQGRYMPIYDLPASASSLSLGSVTMGCVPNANVYSNVSALLHDDSPSTHVAFDYGLTDNKETDNYGLYSLTASHHSDKDVIAAGVRYYAMGGMQHTVDANLNVNNDKLRFYSYSVDVAYARAIGSFSVEGTVGIASEKAIHQTNAFRVNVSGYYNGHISSTRYCVGLGIRDLGRAYANNTSHSLSPLIHAGGSAGIPTFAKQQLDVFLDLGAYMPAGDNKTERNLSGGLAYNFNSRFSIRTGGHLGDHDNFYTTGLGVCLGPVALDLAAKIKSASDQSNILMAGISLKL